MMVRNYIRKGYRSLGLYSQKALKNAVELVVNSNWTVSQASMLSGIPYLTLKYAVEVSNNRPSETSKIPCRRTVISFDHEKILADCLKSMDKWGFELLRDEVLDLVQEYVISNNISTPAFANRRPGPDWFTSFKKRHGLSFKKSTIVKMSHKKQTDPFIVYGYFAQLFNILQENKLLNKPDRIYNFGEMYFCRDHLRVVGAEEEQNTHATNGRHNITVVLFTISADGRKLPPHIIFKGKNVLGTWIPQNLSKIFPNTTYSATENGLLDTETLYKYFRDVFIPQAASPDEPTLLIYDGHCSHMSINLMKLALANNVIILKLPANQSHLLQPLNLTTFFALKNNYNVKLLAKLRKYCAEILSNACFVKLISSVWIELDVSVVMDGFKKGGIYPCSPTVVNTKLFKSVSLKDWERIFGPLSSFFEQFSPDIASIKYPDIASGNFARPFQTQPVWQSSEGHLTSSLSINTPLPEYSNMAAPSNSRTALIPLSSSYAETPSSISYSNSLYFEELKLNVCGSNDQTAGTVKSSSKSASVLPSSSNVETPSSTSSFSSPSSEKKQEKNEPNESFFNSDRSELEASFEVDFLEDDKSTVENSKTPVRPQPHVACKHVDQDSCSANQLTQADIKGFSDRLHSNIIIHDQNFHILQYVTSDSDLRERIQNEKQREQIDTQYVVQKLDGSQIVVCAKTFQSIYGLSQERLNGISREFMYTGRATNDGRGGLWMIDDQRETRQSIIDFIKSLSVTHSHYGRGSSTRRYLPPELSITLLWRLWQAERVRRNATVACRSAFAYIFRTKFNLSFDAPKVDLMCSYCEDISNKIALDMEKDKNQNLLDLLDLHKLEVKQFYKILHDSESNENYLTITFDMQPNQPLPKTNVGEAYHSQQLWLYNFTVVMCSETREEIAQNVFTYTWLESEAGKGSNETVSALRHFFENVVTKQIKEKRYKKIQLFSDSCPRQNKNQAMLIFLLQIMNDRRIKEYVGTIEYYFSVKGHSYLPPDRVFCQFEKQWSKKVIIKTPAEYYEVYSDHGKVFVYGNDWLVYDYKSLAAITLKQITELQIKKNRVWTFSRKSPGTVCTHNYFSTLVEKNEFVPLESNVNIETWEPKLVPTSSHISPKKKKDVVELLKYIQLSPNEQKFYNDELKKPTTHHHVKNENHEKEYSALCREWKRCAPAIVFSPHPEKNVDPPPKKRGRPRKIINEDMRL